MAEQLYALQCHVDELIKDMQELKHSYNSVDFIAHSIKYLRDEQVCQSEQMRRMEEDIRELKTDSQFVKDQLSLMFQQLKLITNHLGIIIN